jgi:hypothetical protein
MKQATMGGIDRYLARCCWSAGGCNKSRDRRRLYTARLLRNKNTHNPSTTNSEATIFLWQKESRLSQKREGRKGGSLKPWTLHRAPTSKEVPHQFAAFEVSLIVATNLCLVCEQQETLFMPKNIWGAVGEGGFQAISINQHFHLQRLLNLWETLKIPIKTNARTSPGKNRESRVMNLKL